MSTQNVTRVSPTYAGNGVTAVFSFDYKVLDKTHLVFQVTDPSGANTEKVLDVDFSVTLNANQDDAPGGYVSYPLSGALLPVGYFARVISRMPVSQLTRLPRGGSYQASVVEDALDNAVMILREQADTLGATVRAPAGEVLSPLPPASIRAAHYLGFDGSGQLSALLPIAGTAGALAADLASTASASTGAGMVGSLWTRNYVAGTLGNDVRYGSVPSIFKVLSAAQQADVLAYGFTLDLYATIAAAYALCKTWYFPAGGYKITDEIAAMTGMRVYGDSNADRFYGAQPTTGNPTRFWQATSSKACFKIGVGVSDVVMSDFCMSAVQTPSAYTAYTAGKYGIKMEGANYVAAGTAIQIAGRSSYRLTLQRLTGYQFERFISCADYYWDTTGLTPPNGGTDWQCDSVDVIQCHSFSCLHHTYINTTNADAWNHRGNTAAVWTGGTGLYLERSGYHVMETCYWVPAEASAGVLASNTTGVFASDWPDNIALIGCAGSDSLAYFLDVDTTPGYANVYNTLTLDTCVVEAPIRIRRKCKVISFATRYTEDVTCSGDDIEVHSTADSWFPTTKKFLMTGLRPRLFVHGGSTQTSGSQAGAATATATTLATIPASPGAYQFFAWLANGGTLYQASAVLMCDGTNLTVRPASNGANLTLTTSGRNVQATQTSGVTQTLEWAYTRLV